MIAEVAGRSPKMGTCWLRVEHGGSHRILTMPDDVIPYGMKSASYLEVRYTTIRSTTQGYVADDLEVLGVADGAGRETDRS